MIKNHLKKTFSEFIRDVTSLGDPFILVLISALLLGFTTSLLKIIIGLIIIELVCSLVKIIYHKERPLKQDFSNILEKIEAGSFPSIHSARSSFVFLFLFLISSSIWIKIISILAILLVGFSRIVLKKHYLFDIISGYVIGVSLSIILKLI